jgi:hypothetical protein
VSVHVDAAPTAAADTLRAAASAAAVSVGVGSPGVPSPGSDDTTEAVPTAVPAVPAAAVQKSPTKQQQQQGPLKSPKLRAGSIKGGAVVVPAGAGGGGGVKARTAMFAGAAKSGNSGSGSGGGKGVLTVEGEGPAGAPRRTLSERMAAMRATFEGGKA